jgi:hypothetical protein
MINNRQERDTTNKKSPTATTSFFSWGEEQHLVFVVLPERKIDDAMLDSTWFTLKTREEQQQVPPQLLFYQSRVAPNSILFQSTKKPKHKDHSLHKFVNKAKSA